jgi:cyclopropane fatty-acyl-phospholipid synthase-like methyltransferase
MDINRDDYNKIIKMIQENGKQSKYELEARIYGKNFSNSPKIDYYKFENILNTLIFTKENGGYEFKNYTVETVMDVKVDDYRLTINDKDSVKMYWLTEDLTDKINYKFIKKSKADIVDLNEYNVRISLSTEDELDEKSKSKMLNLMKDVKKSKTYRLKNRYSIKTPDNMFQIDLTSIKMSEGVSFKKSNVFKASVNYEIELEYIGNDKDVQNVYNALFKYIKMLILLNGKNLIKNSESNSVLESYKQLITYSNNYNSDSNPLFIVVNPVTLHRSNLVEKQDQNIVKDYAVALKADGIRNLLYVLNSSNKDLNGNIYFIDNSLNIQNTGLKSENWSGSLIEGEYIATDNLFLCYDMLYERGNDIRNLPLIDDKKSRLGNLNLFLKTLKQEGDLVIKAKEYSYGENIFEKVEELWNNKDNYEFDVDGLIFTPKKDAYPKKVGSWNRLFKWKPPGFNSFDFLIKVEQNENGHDIKSPYIIYKDNGESVVYQYKTLILYVGKLEYESNKRIYKPVQFNPLNQSEDEAQEINRAKIVLDRNGKMLAHDPITGKYSEILDDTIVEFVYDRSKNEFPWIPIRVRHDKTERYKAGESIFGNNDKTANDIWKSVSMPLTFEMLSQGSVSNTNIDKNDTYYASQEYEPNKRMPFQNFHNLIVKKDLIKEVAPKNGGGKLLDMACGKGGDLNKWTNVGYSDIIGIDIDEGGLEYARKYYNEYNNKSKPEVIYMWGDTSKLIFPNYEAAMDNKSKKEMRDTISSKYMFDVVSSQFCLHYYFESELKLRGFLQNVTDNLKIGGYFIGTCFDGNRVIEALKGKSSIEGKLDENIVWKIDKLYKGTVLTTPKSQYNKNIDVYVSSINSTHRESLVNFEFLDNMLVSYGLEKVKVVEFAEIYDQMNKNSNAGKSSTMSELEKDFSFLNNLFVYRKIKNAPDNVYTKLQSLMKSSK